MRLISTKHSNFRGLKDDEHKFSETNIIIGDNGVGKTSLIEAVYVSLLGTPLNSFNKANKELSRDNNGLFLSESTILNSNGLKSKQAFLSTSKQKKLSVNDTDVTVREAFLSTPICLIDSNIEKEDKKLSEWLKKTETELKIDFGKPDKIEFLNNSNRNYVYVTEKLKIKCVRKFEINPRDIVVGYTSKNCF